jgi:fibro-slime domain-containing protein
MDGAFEVRGVTMKRCRVLTLFVAAAIAACLAACATDNDSFTAQTTPEPGGSGGMAAAGGVGGAAGSGGSGGATMAGAGGTTDAATGDAAGTGGSAGTGGTAGQGGFGADGSRYELGAPITYQGVPNTGVTVRDEKCDTIAGIVRDFKDATEPGGHPDFEAFAGAGATKGLVNAFLGSDEKPVYTGICETAGNTTTCPYGQQTTSKANFNQWYRTVDGVNQPFVVYLGFESVGNMMTFRCNNFFPLDNAGWGNNHTRADGSRNYAFTTEIHLKIKYVGGETFRFMGDDDLWIFINGKLAMDLGGLHPQASDTISLDQQSSVLGITPGNEYTLDLFHAERHTWASNFNIETNFAFTDCGSSIPGEFL